jgi:hypothetical protein
MFSLEAQVIRMMKILTVALSSMLLLAACSPRGVEQPNPTPPGPAPAATSAYAEPSQSIPTPPQEQQIDAVQSVQQALASQLGLSLDAIRIIQVEDAEWPDSCLGLAGEGEMCLDVITPGYLVILQAQERQYIYHTDITGDIFRLERVEE